MSAIQTIQWAVLAGVVFFVAVAFPMPERRGPQTIADPLEIAITGSKFEWHVRYPGPDGVLGTGDDSLSTRDLHVPVGARTRLRLFSRDYIYNMRLPHLGLKEVAVPDLEFLMEFAADEAGTFELRGDQMCGSEHPKLRGKLVVGTEQDFWTALEGMRKR